MERKRTPTFAKGLTAMIIVVAAVTLWTMMFQRGDDFSNLSPEEAFKVIVKQDVEQEHYEIAYEDSISANITFTDIKVSGDTYIGTGTIKIDDGGSCDYEGTIVAEYKYSNNQFKRNYVRLDLLVNGHVKHDRLNPFVF